MIKLIATDIDGTLLPTGSMEPSPALRDCMKALTEKGIHIALTSGRPLPALDRLFPELSDRITFICSNGARIVQQGKTVFHAPIAEGEALQSLMEQVRALGCDYMIDAETVTLTEPGVSETFYRACNAAGLDMRRVPDVITFPEQILKISIAHPKGPVHLAADWHLKPLKEQYNLVATGGVFFDIMAKGVDKGAAVRFLQRQLGVTPAETIVFGDAMNDVPLFSAAENSYAVSTAPALIRQQARFSVDPPEKQGVQQILESILHSTKEEYT